VSRPAQRSAQAYRRLTIRDKQRVALERLRPPPVACPTCGTQTGAEDLLGHVERCQGPREPHPLERWVTSGEVERLGVRRQTLHWWTARGVVRAQIGDPCRYLLRDVAIRIALRQQRRVSRKLDEAKRRGG